MNIFFERSIQNIIKFQSLSYQARPSKAGTSIQLHLAHCHPRIVSHIFAMYSPAFTDIPSPSVSMSAERSLYHLSTIQANGASDLHMGQGGILTCSMRGFWKCCRCNHLNNPAYSPQRCGSCGHGKCASCVVSRA